MEIKEILDYLKIENGHCSSELSYEETHLLLDYITNLQQELEEYKDTETFSKRFLYKANKDRLNANLKLIQENERLKEQNNDLRKIYRNTYNKLFENGNDELARYFQAQIDECRTFYVEPIIDYHKEWKDYKLRIEKAVKYISSNCILSREWKEVEFCKFLATETITYKALSRGKIKELLNILNGKE